MGKKKRKSRKQKSVLNNSSSRSSVSEEASLCSSFISINISTSSLDDLPTKFLITSIVPTKYADYIKCLRSDFNCVLLINSSVMISYGVEDLVLVKGEDKKQLCVAHPLENLKKNLVLFPKDNCGFHENEYVTIEPYFEKIRTAEKIYFLSDGIEDINKSIQDYILRLICNRFIYVGMTIKLNLFGMRYIFTINNIIASKDLSNFEESPFENSFYIVSSSTTLKFRFEVLQSENNYFENIGGLEKEIKKIKQYFQLLVNSKYDVDSVFCGTLILQGPPGTGKSLLLQSLIASCKLFKVHAEHIWWYELFALHRLEIKKKLEAIFLRSLNHVPSLIIFEDFNHLCPIEDDSENIQLYILKILSRLSDSLNGARVMIIVANNEPNFDESIFKTKRRLVDVIAIKYPSQIERVEILKKILNSKNHELTFSHIQECAESAHGFTGRDSFAALCDAEILCIKRAFPNINDSNELLQKINTRPCSLEPILYSDLKMALELKKPTIVASSELQLKRVQWSDIGGMHNIKEKLKQLVEWPLKYPEAFKHFNISPSRGVLMYGPPGCSKTLIAKALATECSVNFISKKASELFNKYVGESEKAVRDLFATSKSKTPCIIFLDEIDALVAGRGSSSTSSGVGDRIVATFLTEMDGIEELNGVIIIAATNRPDMLDEALIRNGRINHFIYVPLPDANAREEIFEINMSKRTVSENFDYKLLALKTEGYSGAEIVNICNEAALQLLAENPRAEMPVFTMNHFEEALNQVLPRTNKKMIEFYERFNEKHCTKL